MTVLAQLEGFYQKYAEQAHEARSKARVFDGLLGLGSDPRNHPCHQEFYENVGTCIAEFSAGAPSDQEITQVVRWLLEAAYLHRDDKETYWFLYAAQRHTLGLIPRLPAQACQTLLTQFDKMYRKIDRMPVQQEIFKLLRKGAKEKT